MSEPTDLVPTNGTAIIPAEVADGPQLFAGFGGMATVPFDDKARAVLSEPVDPKDVQIRPDGIVYMPGVWYRRQLTRAFGAGAWALPPREYPQKMGEVIIYHGALIVLSRFVSEAWGECATRGGMTYASALEGSRTDCLSKCCKDLGMAMELWDKQWIEAWKAQYAHVAGTDDRGKPKWVRNDEGAPPVPKGATPASTPTGTGSAPASKPKRSTAADVKPTGGGITPEQLRHLHALRDEVGGLAGDDPRGRWAKTINVYRKPDGTRCEHSNELSKDQCSHLIDRLKAWIAKQGERATATPVDVPPPSLEDLLQKHFTDQGEAAWLHSLFEVEHRRELTAEQEETARALLAVMHNDAEYERLETVARSTGRIR